MGCSEGNKSDSDMNSYFFIPRGSWAKISFWRSYGGWTNYIETKTETDCFLSEKYFREDSEESELCAFDIEPEGIFIVVEKDSITAFKPKN